MTTPDEAQATFDRNMVLETLRSERLRCELVVTALIAGLLSLLGYRVIRPEDFAADFPGERALVEICAFFLAMILYELAIRALVRRAVACKDSLAWPNWLRYVNAFVEVSFPTLPIIIVGLTVDPTEALLIPPVFLYFHFIILSTLRLDFRLCAFTGVVASIEYAAAATLVTRVAGPRAMTEPALNFNHHMGKALFLFLAGVVAGFVASQIKRRIENSFAAVAERNRVVGMFGQHVSPAIVNKLLSQKSEMESEVRTCCVMFLDIRNFTSYCEDKSPEEVVSFLNQLFGFMIDVINEYDGIINKFLGDGFMAVFGAPIADGQDCRHAVEASLGIIERLHEEVERGALPPTSVGIGLHAGEAVTGNVGSPQRKEYTIIGDVVNLSSRIESLNKQFESQLLVSDTVWRSLDDETRARVPGAKEQGPVVVKGREAPVLVHQLV